MEFLAWVPGPWEIAIIAVIALLFFGRRLPELGRGLGKSITEFKKGLQDGEGEADKPAKSSGGSNKDSTA